MMAEENGRPRLLFICLDLTSFVRDDLKLLRERYDVRLFRFSANRAASRAGRGVGVAREAVRQLAWLRRELPRADLVYGWFADYHLALPVFLARRYGVPVAVPIAGFDAIRLPKLGYGVYESVWRAPLARYALRHASLILPCSETMIEHANRYSAYPERLENGVRAHVPGFSTPYAVVPFGYDAAAWPMGPLERKPSVLTVGHMTALRTFRRKGGDLFIAAARRLPDVAFQVIGVPEEEARAIRNRYDPPENVALLPPRPRQALAEAYGQASVYAQLSRAEGQPNVLSEAMCCGCVPVGSPVFGIPETIGEAGVIAETPEPDVLAGALRKALALASPEARQRARRRITEHFSTEHRRRALFRALARLTQAKNGGRA